MNKNLIALQIFRKKIFKGIVLLLQTTFCGVMLISTTIPVCIWTFTMHDHTLSNPWTSILWGSMILSTIGISIRECKQRKVKIWESPHVPIFNLWGDNENYPHDISTSFKFTLEGFYQCIVSFSMPLLFASCVGLLVFKKLGKGLISLGRFFWRTPSFLVKVRDEMIDGNPEEAARLEKKKLSGALPSALNVNQTKRL